MLALGRANVRQCRRMGQDAGSAHALCQKSSDTVEGASVSGKMAKQVPKPSRFPSQCCSCVWVTSVNYPLQKQFQKICN